MNIVVCLKQLSDAMEVKIDSKTGIAIRRCGLSIINSQSESILEKALKLKKDRGAKVTVICMETFHAETVLEEAIAMGADEGILISDKSLVGAGEVSISSILAAKIKKLNYDILFISKQVIEDSGEEITTEITRHLGTPRIIFRETIDFKDAEWA